MRRPKTNRVERTRASGEWSEAQFWSFIRSGLRQLSRRWPPLVRHVYLQSRRDYRGDNKRQKHEYQCSACGDWFMRKNIQADHIAECGSLKSFADLPGFVERLLCEVEGLRLLCETCHQERTNEERRKRGENGE